MSDDFSILASIDADDANFQKAFARADATAAKVEAKIAAAMSKIDKATSAAFRSAEVESRKLQLALERTFSAEGAEKARKAAAAALEVAKANREGAQAALGGARAADEASGGYARQRQALDMLVKANRAYQAAQESVAAAGQRVAQIEAAARIERETLAVQKAAQAQADYNRMLGISGQAEAERIASAQAYGASLDQLRAKYVPLEAVQEAYEAEVREINMLHLSGALTLDEYNQALARSQASLNTATQVYSSGAAGAGRYGAAIQQAGFQVGDFAVQVASGQGVLRPLIQQGTQLVSMFGPLGAVIGAAGAIIGAVTVALMNMETETVAAEEAQQRLSDALKSSAKDAEAAGIAENILAEAVERASKGTSDLTDASFARLTSLRDQERQALATAQAEVTLRQEEAARAAQELQDKARRAGVREGAIGGVFSAENDAAIAAQRKRAEDALKARDDIVRRIGEIDAAQSQRFQQDFTAPLQAQIDFETQLAAALGKGADAIREVNTQEKIRQELTRAGVAADSDRGKQIAQQIRQREELAARNQKLTEAERKRQAEIERTAEETAELSRERQQTFADMESELRYLTELAIANGQGAEAIARVEDARKAEIMIQRLKLDEDSREADLIRSLITLQEDQRRKIDAITDAQKEAERASEKALAKQKKAVEDATREYEKLVDSIANVSQEKLGDALFDSLKGETLDFAEFMKDVLLRTVSDIAAAMLTQQIVIPIAAQVIGAAPGLFGLSAGAAGVAQQAAGGGLGGINPLSFLNAGGGGGIYNTFATSGLGSALGLSSAYAGLGGAFGVSAATAPATLALSGPLGGFGTAVGGATASTGGLVGAAGLGGATAPGLTGLGAGLGAALPYIGIALAGLSLFSGMFQGNPSVGPVGVADFSPGLGRRRAFDVAGIDPFTADNGGNGESLRPIAEAIADLIADSADRFSATINESLRFRVANYQGPEMGSGRASGFEVNAFINQEAERRVAEGLSQEQAVFEAFKFAIQEAFTFDSATIAEAAANTAATTTEEILADLDFAKNFEALGQALENLGGTVDANTLALAQQTLAIQKQAEDFATANAQPILDAFEKARELFPATRSGEETRRITERGVFVNEGEGKRDRRFVEEGTDEFDRLTSGSDPLRVVTRIRTVTEEVDTQAENFAANLERMRQATEVANASVELLVDQVTGEFEPAVRGPFQTALEQGQANLEELATYFDDLNEQITDANEAFPGLNAALIDTNTVITDAMAALREQLQQDFTDSIQRQMNAAQGLGGINVINDLIDTRSQNATDAASLGLDVNSTAGALFDAQLRQALEGSSLADLGALLSSGQIVDEGARAIVEAVLAEEALAAIRVEEVAGMQELYAATEQFASAAKNNARTLRQAADALLVDPNLSPLSPELRLQEARRQFEEAFGLANDDDPTDELSQDAIQRLPGLSQTMLEASRAYYGSTEGYLADFNRAQDVLNNTALRQESVEQQQLDALRDIEAAIAAAGGSVVGRTPAEQAASSGFNFGGESERNQRIYNALVAAGLPTPEGFGGSVSGNLGQLRAANPAVDALVTAMGFATGGSFTVAGPAGNDNLLMPLRLTAGEAVNVSRGDSMAAMSQRLESLVSLQAESNQINKALLHENAQQARSLSRANAENAKLNRLLTDRQAAQPRVAYR